MSTKIDIINKAYSRLRISGITVIPSSEDVETALDRLESMAEGWQSKYNTDYYFEDSPQASTPHNIPRRHWAAYETALAMELIPDFGKEIPAQLMRLSNAAFSRLAAEYTRIKRVDAPSRQPVASNVSTNVYYVDTDSASPNAYKAYTGEIKIFYEDFSSYLGYGETVSSYTIEETNNITISGDSLTGAVITYTVTFDNASELEEVVITITTSAGQKEIHKKQFVISDAN